MSAPDPHVLYRRARRVDAVDGPLLLVGKAGVLVVPLASEEEADAESAGATGVAASLYTFARLSELVALPDAPDVPETIHRIATFAGEPIYAASVREQQWECASVEEVGYRELYGSIGDDELALVSRAVQIVDWDETTQFCPRCGARTEPSESEVAKRCPSCTHTQYPRLAPAMIVGIVRDGKLLLAQSPRFRGSFHSILAGFVEAGETVEQCIRREVFEEVGISVRNVRYFGSQPWPFPHSLMLGFTAEYDSGELNLDSNEIVHADWYAPDELPNVPGEVSISGRIISWFRSTYG